MFKYIIIKGILIIKEELAILIVVWTNFFSSHSTKLFIFIWNLMNNFKMKLIPTLGL